MAMTLYVGICISGCTATTGAGDGTKQAAELEKAPLVKFTQNNEELKSGMVNEKLKQVRFDIIQSWSSLIDANFR